MFPSNSYTITFVNNRSLFIDAIMNITGVKKMKKNIHQHDHEYNELRDLHVHHQWIPIRRPTWYGTKKSIKSADILFIFKKYVIQSVCHVMQSIRILMILLLIFLTRPRTSKFSITNLIEHMQKKRNICQAFVLHVYKVILRD